MVAAMKELKPVTPQPGKPLYLTVKDAVRDAITAGIFSPGEQMPSTKELSEQLSVSLVTAGTARCRNSWRPACCSDRRARARSSTSAYLDREKTLSDTRVGLIFHREASLADFYHSQVLEGVRQAAQQLSVDLILLRYGEDVRNECNGYLFVNPLPSEVDHICGESRRNQPILTVGAKSDDKRISSIDVDNIDLVAMP